MHQKFAKEADLARPIVAELRKLGWAVYQEVDYRGNIADIVAVWENKYVWIIETKLHLNLTVISQAWKWLRFAHYVSIGIPAGSRAARGLEAAYQFLSDYGIGVLVVGATRQGLPAHDLVDLYRPVRFNRHARVKTLLESLRQEHMTYKEAGSVEGKRFTPFRATCEEFFRIVRAHPGGVLLKDAFAELKGKHHYSSDASMRQCLSTLCRQGVFKADVELFYQEDKLWIRATQK